MSHRHRRLRRSQVALAFAAVALMTAACNANPDVANPTVSFGQTQHGGTLTVYTDSTDLDLDPGKSQSLPITTPSWLHRRLTTWQAVPGEPTVPVPDLATDTGTTADGGKTWRYTLKEGLRFSDGSPITSQDVKYGLERSFAPLLAGGLNYHKALLDGGDTYTGPYEGKSLDSIEVPDARTIVFHLNRTFADWPWIVSQAAFSPVPEAKDDPRSYGRSPITSGPYAVKHRDTGRVVLERNSYWSAETDSNRTAGPDEIVMKLGQDANTSVKAIIQDQDDARSGFFSGFVPPAQLADLRNNPRSSTRLAEAGGGSLKKITINTERVRDKRVREAILYATDRQSYRTALGGDSRGTLATTNIPPALPGAEPFDLFHSGPSGDVQKAKQLLDEAGSPDGLDLVFVVLDNATDIAGAESIQASLARANIRVQIRPLDLATFEDVTKHQDGSGYDLILESWQADYPSAAAVLQPSYASSEIGNGGVNESRYRNPAVDQLIDRALGETDTAAAEKSWVQIDKLIAEDVPAVPLVNTVNTFVFGSKVQNFYVPPFPAYPNYSTISVAE